MVLNYIWVAFFVIALIVGLIKLIFLGDMEVFPAMMTSTFEMSKVGFEIALGLTGVLTLWMGLMKVGEKGGVIRMFSKLIDPFFRKLFPELPKDHPATGTIMMNVAANMLGLDNAATPIGLKAMKELQDSNPDKTRASNAQIMFLVLNTSGLTLIPVSIMVYRAEAGAADPSDIFIPIILATYFSTLAGLIAVSVYQRLNLLNRTVLTYLGIITAVIISIILYMSTLSKDEIQLVSSLVSSIILYGVIVSFILLAAFKRINVYESFIEGAKKGFSVAVKIIPYLIAILVAIGVFRASGAMGMLTKAVGWCFAYLGVNTDFVPSLPTALMRPLSGSGARGMLVELMESTGPDSFSSKVASVLQGSTDTTFYVLAVYFGSVGIRNTRYAVTCGLIADFVGIIAAILIAYLFFH